MNQAYFHGQNFKWDPVKFTFVDGTGDPAWLTWVVTAARGRSRPGGRSV